MKCYQIALKFSYVSELLSHFSVSCGKLIKQAIADETQLGLSCKPYVDKNMAGKFKQDCLKLRE